MASTMKDIAKKTGLGLATISKYLNGGHVLDENKKAIDEAIDELDFSVNEIARGLKTRKSKTVGIVIPELTNFYSTTVIRTLEDILRNHGYAVIICDCRTDEAIERQAIEFLINKKVDGLINVPASHSSKSVELVLKKGIPIVLLDRILDGLNLDSVLLENVDAAQKAVSYMIQNGHRKIGIICGPQNIYTSQQRLAGYYKAFKQNGLAPEEPLVISSDYTVNGGYEKVKELLRDNRELTAVFATNYEMTLGAIIAINELGIRLHDDLSFIGFDNPQFSQIFKPSLTIVSQPLSKIGEQAADLILSSMSENQCCARIIMESAKLEIGGSVRNIS